MASPYGVDRRTLLRLAVLGSAAALAGCSSAGSSPSASGVPSASGSPLTPSGSASPPAGVLPVAQPWQAVAGEVHPEVKLRALRALEAAGTWHTAGGGTVAAAAGRLRALGVNPALAASLTPLLGSEPGAVVRVVDAQYGGILDTSSSVLAVLDQWRRLADGRVRESGTTVDVRLVAASPRWRITEWHPATPGAAAASSALSAKARAVLASNRIRLPYAGRADIASGQVHDSVLTALLGLAERHVVDVSVVRSGHPIFVFGTSRRSDHPRGRAVDIWALDGKRVVEPANRAFVEAAMRLAATLGPYQVGGPVDLDAGGTQYFSDDTHHDHLHLGFRT
jgi:hypothetical protein